MKATSPEPDNSSRSPAGGLAGEAGAKGADDDNLVLILAIVIPLAVLLLLGVAGGIG